MSPFKAGEKITDPVVLERLAKARAKALEVRQANKKLKDDEKLLQQKEKKKKALEVSEKLDAMNKPSASASPQSSPKKEDTRVESEPEEEVIVVKKKKKPPKKKVIYVNESQSESEDEYSKPSKAYEPPLERPQPIKPVPKEMSYADKMFAASYGRLTRF